MGSCECTFSPPVNACVHIFCLQMMRLLCDEGMFLLRKREKEGEREHYWCRSIGNRCYGKSNLFFSCVNARLHAHDKFEVDKHFFPVMPMADFQKVNHTTCIVLRKKTVCLFERRKMEKGDRTKVVKLPGFPIENVISSFM